MEGFYLSIIGIDESNHGRIPEVFVAALSNNSNSLMRENRSLGKQRNENTAKRLIRDVYFKHIIYSDVHRKIFSDEQIKVVSIAEFVIGLDKIGFSVDDVIFDGTLDQSHIETIERIIYPRTTSIIVVPKADNMYKIVNDADAIANYLYRYYSTGIRKHDYLKHLFTPVVEQYMSLFK